MSINTLSIAPEEYVLHLRLTAAAIALAVLHEREGRGHSR
jgi:hypothetical protein